VHTFTTTAWQANSCILKQELGKTKNLPTSMLVKLWYSI